MRSVQYSEINIKKEPCQDNCVNSNTHITVDLCLFAFLWFFSDLNAERCSRDIWLAV